MKDLVGRALGPLCHSRWLTLGARILYHCKKLVTLTEFVVRAYTAVWYRERQYPKGTDAPRHYFQWMQALKSFPTCVFKAVSSIFENGLFWCHSKNMLLSALSDEDSKIREKAVNQILKIRNDCKFREIIKERGE